MTEKYEVQEYQLDGLYLEFYATDSMDRRRSALELIIGLIPPDVGINASLHPALALLEWERFNSWVKSDFSGDNHVSMSSAGVAFFQTCAADTLRFREAARRQDGYLNQSPSYINVWLELFSLLPVSFSLQLARPFSETPSDRVTRATLTYDRWMFSGSAIQSYNSFHAASSIETTTINYAMGIAYFGLGTKVSSKGRVRYEAQLPARELVIIRDQPKHTSGI